MNVNRTPTRFSKRIDAAMKISILVLIIVVTVSFFSQLNAVGNGPVYDLEEMTSSGLVTIDESGIHLADQKVPLAGASSYLVDLSSMWED